MNIQTLHQESSDSLQEVSCEDRDKKRLAHIALQIASNKIVAHRMALPNAQIGNLALNLGMLALLIYCYAAGLYESNEIENAAIHDPRVRALSANLAFSVADIRFFRRHFRALLKEYLGEALCWAWRFGIWSAFSMPPCGNSTPLIFARSSTESETELMFERIAEDRINDAVRRDSMALDD